MATEQTHPVEYTALLQDTDMTAPRYVKESVLIWLPGSEIHKFFQQLQACLDTRMGTEPMVINPKLGSYQL